MEETLLISQKDQNDDNIVPLVIEDGWGLVQFGLLKICLERQFYLIILKINSFRMTDQFNVI